MKNAPKMIFFLVAVSLIVFIAGSAQAHWDPDPQDAPTNHKMHYPQMPDPHGWDIDMTQFILADDWECSQTGPVADIHFWYSVAFDQSTSGLQAPHFTSVNVKIYDDVPVGANANPDYSHPGVQLWERQFDVVSDMVAGPWGGVQGWDTPDPDSSCRYEDHIWYWQLNITDIANAFEQEAGKIYWLELQVFGSVYEGVGWKTSLDQFNDVAVYQIAGAAPTWAPIQVCDANYPTDLAFVITPEPATLGLLLLAGLALLRRRP